MDKNIDILIGKWISGNISEVERTQLRQWVDSAPGNSKVLEEAEQLWKISGSAKQNEFTNVDSAWTEFQSLSAKKPVKSIMARSLPVAAAIVLLICLGFLLNYFMVDEKVNVAPVAATSFHRDTLPDTLILNEPYVTSPPVLQPLTAEIKRKNELMAVNAGDSALVFTLPDSSRVYLNKNSKLTYPERFAKNNRTVYLSGEAFFEVTKHKGEFIVICQDTKTRVLGTSFNIKGYQPNNQVEVTVITGLVEVTNTSGRIVGKQLVLKPGEQAIFNAKTDQAVRSKNVKKDKWWKKKNFRTKIKQFINKITNKKNNH